MTSGRRELTENEHRALSGASRQALVRALADSAAPVDAPLLAERVRLHVNTVRWHLGVLAQAGLVIEQRAPAVGRGRPRHLYSLREPRHPDEPGGALLVDVLVDAIAGEIPPGRLEEAGRRRGRELVEPRVGGSAPSALADVVQLLRRLGFQPRLQRSPAGRRIAMRPCPLGEHAADRTEVVCPVHLGLIRGALERAEAPLRVAALEPFARPDLCVAHLEPAVARRVVSE